MQPIESGISAPQTRIVTLVEDILSRNRSDGASALPAVPTDWDLVEIGLTSVDMVNLMLAVEAEFDITIPPFDITPENFRSIETIHALVTRLREPEEVS
ncbi:MAG: acyl carrier protein [Bauldia sp.]|nr:acyl carrier protein [Bauldia sp.]